MPESHAASDSELSLGAAGDGKRRGRAAGDILGEMPGSRQERVGDISGSFSLIDVKYTFFQSSLVFG